MYQAPDFVKVDINLKDSFAAASTTCPGDYSGEYMYTGIGCKDWVDPSTLVGGSVFTYLCYSAMNQ